MAHERKAYSISYQISTHKQVFVTLSSCIGLKRNIGGSVLRRVLRICHVTWPPYFSPYRVVASPLETETTLYNQQSPPRR